MTTNDDEKAAEEYTCEALRLNSNFPLEVQRDPEGSAEVKLAFLAGIAHERAKHRWISVKERVPEFGDIFIARWAGGDYEIMRCQEGTQLYNGMCEAIYVDNYGDEQCDEFTHWMPLPSAPEGDK